MYVLAGVAVSCKKSSLHRRGIYYNIGTYPTPDCKFVLSVVRTFLSYQHNSRRRYCTDGADTKKKNSISTAPGVV
jgi:hypothetical protein